MKSKKGIFIILGVILVGAVVVYSYLNKSHRDIATEETNFKITASKLLESFQKDENTANKKYLNKTIEVEGLVTSVDANNLTMQPGVFFALSENQTTPKTNTTLVIKGRCIGYDNLLEEIKFDQATILTK